MDWHNKLHILVTSGSSSGVRELHLPKKLAKVLLVFIILFLISTGVITYLFVTKELDRNKLQNLQTSNQKLEREMNHLISEIDTLKYNLENLKDADKRVRQLEGLEPIDEDIRKMGVGGTQYLDSLFSDYNKEIFQTHNTLLRKIEELQRQIKFEKISYEEIAKFVNVKNTIYKHTPSIRPAYGRISDKYGYRYNPFSKKREFHHGVDIGSKIGEFVYTTADGKISEAGYHKIYGYYLAIRHGYGYTTFFGHLSKFYVEIGDRVTKHQIIGEIGNSGISTGPHLHYEVHFYGKSRNPINYFDKKKSTIFVDSRYIS